MTERVSEEGKGERWENTGETGLQVYGCLDIILISFYFLFFFIFFNFIFKFYIIVLVLPNIKMNPPQVYMCSPS